MAGKGRVGSVHRRRGHEGHARGRDLDRLREVRGGSRRGAPGPRHRTFAHLSHDPIGAAHHVDLAILEVRALLDAVVVTREDRLVELLDRGEQGHVLLDREERSRAVAGVEVAVAQPLLHVGDLGLERVRAQVARRCPGRVPAHDAHAAA